MNIEFDEMISWVNENGFSIKGIVINQTDLIFEERVKMNCFYCAKYNVSWKCPPKIPVLDYKKMFLEFDNAAFIYTQMALQESDYDSVRKNSSIYLHQAMLLCEKWLYVHNNTTALSFIGGSCKLCKNGCTPEHCANPYQARVPVEALGINVIKSAIKYGIEIKFPPGDFMIRIGLLLW